MSSIPPYRQFKLNIMSAVEEALRTGVAFKSCIACTYFDHQKELCGLSCPPSRPPAKVIALGCPSFDDIPF